MHSSSSEINDKALSSFLIGFHPDMNDASLSDEDIVKEFAAYPPGKYKPGYHRDTLEAGKRFLSSSNPNWEGVSILMNRSFDQDDEQARTWLVRMINLLEEELDRKDEEFRRANLG